MDNMQLLGETRSYYDHLSRAQIIRPWDETQIYAIPSNFAVLSVGFLLIEYNKDLVFNVYYLQNKMSLQKYKRY